MRGGGKGRRVERMRSRKEGKEREGWGRIIGVVGCEGGGNRWEAKERRKRKNREKKRKMEREEMGREEERREGGKGEENRHEEE